MRLATLARFGAPFLVFTSGCGTDGETPRCDDYPAPYDVRVPARRAEAWEELAKLAAGGRYCTTLPAGFTPSGASTAGEGGAGAAGEGGAAGTP